MNTDISLLSFVRPTLLKVVKAHIGLKEWDKAIEEAKKHVDNEESVEGLHAMGEAQLAAERFDEAVRWYQRAMEIAVSVQTSLSRYSVNSTTYIIFAVYLCSFSQQTFANATSLPAR